MSFSQFGYIVSASIGTYTGITGNQYNIHNHFAPSDSRLHEIRKILKLLDPANLDATQREGCLPGTRTEVIDSILEWIQISNTIRSKNVLLIRGLAGSGKSTLATTIVNRIIMIKRLGAFIFFERDVAVRSDPATVIRTLAYKLGLSHPALGEAIAAMVEAHPDIAHYPLRSQFELLIAQPMASEGAIDPTKPIIIVLDALDECGNPDTRRTLLELLVEKSRALPILFVITSRPLADVSGFFEDRDHILNTDLEIATETNSQDILIYLKQNMARIQREKHPLCKDWPGDEKLMQLVARASGLFVWASTACKFVDTYSPHVRLETLLKGPSASTAEHALDRLYQIALLSAGSWDSPDFVTDFRAVLGFILIARRPLAKDDIVALLGQSVTDSCDVISQLGCVLQLAPTVRLLHPSFKDFLSNPQRFRSSNWFWDDGVLHHSLALACIEHLDALLEENKYSMSMASEWVHITIPEHIAYACSYWVDHICVASESATIVTPLENFLHRHLLHWVEIMSILKASRSTIGILEQLSAWLSVQVNCPAYLLTLVNDGVRFVRLYDDLIEEHPLLVYSSALPFTPQDTMLYRTFHDHVAYPTLRGTLENFWSPLLQSITGHGALIVAAISPDGTQIVSVSLDGAIQVRDTSGIEVLPAMNAHEYVQSVAFSPSGTRIASGSWDKTIRLWDATSGAEVLVIHGNTDAVESVTFSSDGNRIISGSRDGIIRIWDAYSGAEVQCLLGHTDEITSVACSQTHIASGSYDHTVRIWDIESSLELLPPLQGHTAEVMSVAFSPHGAHIASASEDRTVRIWNVTTGEEAIPPLIYTDSIHAVSFSPDGIHIVCGSRKEVWVWDITTGAEIIPPLHTSGSRVTSVSFFPDGTRFASLSRDGPVQVWDATSRGLSSQYESRTRCIRSLAFSPDGTRLASGSYDTVRLWDAASGVQLFSILQEHSKGVRSVAFSPDGTRIASGSVDQAIRICDATTGLEVFPPLRGHTEQVMSVAFSPDGSRIASGSSDKTVRVWDATTGLEVLTIWGHDEQVFSVAFSPDGSRIASGSFDKTVRVWDATTGLKIVSTWEHGEAYGCHRVHG